MSSISAGQGSTFPSPTVRAHHRIAAQTAAGTISGTDQAALDTAVDGIDAALKGSETENGAGATRLDPADMKARIDDLIGQQVQSGALTSDQAETLKTVLAGEGSGSPIAGTGHGGQAHGGPPPIPPGAPAGDPQSGTADTTSQNSNDLLATFVKQLQSAQDRASPYGSSGTRATATSASPLLMNFKV